MKKCFIAALLVGLVSPAALLAAELYDCQRIAAADKNAPYRKIAAEYVELSVDGENIKSRIQIKAASKAVTFSSCAKLADDGSNFSRWFANECKELKSADGGSFSYEPFLAGAYAGVSPLIDKAYPIYEKLAAISQEAGVAMPVRTFAIYANRKPQYEFFCYRRAESK